MKNMIALILILLGCISALIRPSDHNESSREITLQLNHYKAYCQGEYPQLCFLVKREGDTLWTYFDDEIENFHYQWGYTYSLKVLEKDLESKDVPADASSKRYELIEERSKVKVSKDETFTIRNLESLIHSTKDLRLHIQNQFIECISEEVSSQMKSLRREHRPFNGLFKHGEKPWKITLISIEVQK